MRAIDIHVHVPDPPGHPAALKKENMAGYFKAGDMPRSPQEMYETYKALDLFGVIFAIDAETTSGIPYVGNDYVASVVQQYPDRFIGFASVDPWKGASAIQELDRSVKELGLRELQTASHHPGVFSKRHTLLPALEEVRGAWHSGLIPHRANGCGCKNTWRGRL